MSYREIENASLKQIIGARIYEDFSEKSDENYFAGLKRHWEALLTQLRRQTRADNELEKILARKDEINLALSNEMHLIIDSLCEGIKSGRLSVTWDNDQTIFLGDSITLRKDRGTLAISWDQYKKGFGFPIEHCKKLIILLPYPDKQEP